MKRMNREEWLVEVSQDGFALPRVPKQYLNYEMCLAAVKRYGSAIHFIPAQYIDYKICLTAIMHFIRTQVSNNQTSNYLIEEDLTPDLINEILDSGTFKYHPVEPYRYKICKFLGMSDEEILTHPYQNVRESYSQRP